MVFSAFREASEAYVGAGADDLVRAAEDVLSLIERRRQVGEAEDELVDAAAALQVQIPTLEAAHPWLEHTENHLVDAAEAQHVSTPSHVHHDRMHV